MSSVSQITLSGFRRFVVSELIERGRRQWMGRHEKETWIGGANERRVGASAGGRMPVEERIT
jgi:hypothetical protein